MDTKKIIGTVLVALGFLGLVPGVLGIFEKQQFFGLSPWALVILGIIFFTAGVGLIKSVRSGTPNANSNQG